MRKLSKILAVLLTVCLLCGVIATLVSATDETYTHPTLSFTNDKIENYTNETFEGFEIGKTISSNNWANYLVGRGTLPSVAESAIPGTSQTNKYLLFESAENELSHWNVLNTSFTTCAAGSYNKYFYLSYTNWSSKASANFFGTSNVDGAMTDEGAKVYITNPYSYYVYDLDIAAMGYRVDLADGTVLGATQVVTNHDGSTTATLTDGTLLTTSKDGKTTTQVNTDGTKLVTVTASNKTTVTEYDADDAVVTVTATVKNTDGSYVKTVTGSDDAIIKKIERTAGDTSYTLTFKDAADKTTKTVTYTLTGSKSTVGGTYTETLVVTEGETVTTYTTTGMVHDHPISTFVDTMTQVRKQGDVTTTNTYTLGSNPNVEYENYTAEFEAALALTDTDINGAHIKSYNLSYGRETQIIFDGIRYQTADGAYKTGGAAGWKIRYIGGEWWICNYSGGTQLVKLPDVVGEWTHLTAVASIDGIYFFTNGEYTHKAAYNANYSLTSGEYAAYFECLRLCDNDVIPYKSYTCYAIDNYTENMYKADYTSGDAYGIDDVIKDIVGGKTASLVNCTDTVYNSSYVNGNNGYIQIDDGEKIYNKALANAALAGVTDGATVKSTMNISGATLPETVKGITVLCDTDEVTVSFTNARVFTMKDGYYVLTQKSLKLSEKSKLTANTTHKVTEAAKKRVDLYAAEWGYSYGTEDAGFRRLSNYDYVTIDFDLAANGYRYTLDGTDYLADTLADVPDDATNVKLAYSDGMIFQFDQRGYIGTAQSGRYLSFSLKLVYDSTLDKWQVCAGDFVGDSYTRTGLYLSDTLGEWNHFTYVIKRDTATIAASAAYLYYNGTLAYTGTLRGGHALTTAIGDKTYADIEDYVISGISIEFRDSNDSKDIANISVANFVSNFYAKGDNGYTTEGTVGIDDLFTGTDVKLADCTDTVYHNYVYPAPNGYVQIEGKDPVYFTGFDSVLDALTTGDTLYVNSENLTIKPKDTVDNFTVWCFDGATVDIDKSYITTDNGDGSYSVRKPIEDEVVKFTVKDPDGNIIAPEQTLLPNTAVTLPDGYFDPATGKYIYVGANNWYFDLMTDTSEEGYGLKQNVVNTGFYFTAQDINDGLINKNVTVSYDKNEDETAEEKDKYKETPITTYAIYYTGDLGFTQLTDKVENFTTANFVTKVNAAPDNATVILYAARTEIKAAESFTVPAGATLNFDLNGKLLVQGGGATWGNATFMLNTGSTVNIYSSKAGGALYAIETSGSGDYAFLKNTEGFVSNAYGAYNCTANIGAYNGANGDNLAMYTSGEMFCVRGFESALADGDFTIKFNIDGGYYYTTGECRHGVNVVGWGQTDTYLNTYISGVEYNLKNAHFFSRSETSNLFSINTSNAVSINIDNSDVYVLNRDSKTTVGTLVSGTKSDVHVITIANSRVYASLAITAPAKMVLGANNVIAWNPQSILTDSNHSLAENVGIAFNTENKNTVSFDFTLPKILWQDQYDLKHYKVEASNTTEAEKYYYYIFAAMTNGITDAQIADTVTPECTVAITAITYDTTSETLPELVKKITHTDASGTTTTAYGIVGNAITHPALTQIDSDWFKSTSTWVYAGTENVAGSLVTDGDNSFTVKTVEAAQIKNALANVSLFTDMTFNYYIPVSSDVTNLKVDGKAHASTVTYEGAEYYLVTAKLKTEDFNGTTVTVTYTYGGKDLTKTVTLDAVKYASLVLANTEYACGSAEKQLVYAIVKYKGEAALYANSSFTLPANYNEFMAEVAKHGESCTCGNVNATTSEEEKNASLESISSITGIAYTLTTGNVGMFIQTDATLDDLTVAYTNVKGEGVLFTVGNGIEKREGGYLVTGISASDLDNVMTVTAGEASGTWSLYAYMTALTASDESAQSLATALYNYAKAAEAYKVATAG